MCLIFNEIDNPFFSGIFHNAEEVALKNGYNVILCITDNNIEKEKNYIESLNKMYVDGYLVNPSTSESSKHFENIKDNKVVFFDRCSGMKDGICVKLDNFEGVKLGVEYLLNYGHTKIGVIHGPLNVTPSIERLTAYKKILSDNDIEIDESIIKLAKDFSAEGGYEKTKELLQSDNRPTAIFSHCGGLSIGALKAIKELNLKIPDDISMIGFDNSNYTEFFDPPLTCIAQPVDDFGKISMEILIKLINGRDVSRRTVELKPELIVRHSCKKLK